MESNQWSWIIYIYIAWKYVAREAFSLQMGSKKIRTIRWFEYRWSTVSKSKEPGELHIKLELCANLFRKEIYLGNQITSSKSEFWAIRHGVEVSTFGRIDMSNECYLLLSTWYSTHIWVLRITVKISNPRPTTRPNSTPRKITANHVTIQVIASSGLTFHKGFIYSNKF